jgi:hypothetical protein
MAEVPGGVSYASDLMSPEALLVNQQLCAISSD